MNVPTQRMSTHVYVDFDGTIMACDTTDFLFERFALPAWRDIEAEWASGKIGSAECMRRQVDLLRVTPAGLDAAVADLEIDPGFEDFVSNLQDQGIGISVVSDGLDKVIAATLRRCGLDVPYFANHLVSQGADRWLLEFPYSRPDCSVAAGHCKCSRTGDGKPEHFKVVVGDGRSDFCIAGRADLVLAKASLLDTCKAKGLPHLPFRDFYEVTELLNGWLDAGPTRKQDPQRELLGA
jgi:2-hydroxy-3-keto-5-methylthiopentenyl-1-phosphate phosphatase